MSLRRARSIRVLVPALLALAFAPASLGAQTAIVNGHTVTLVSATPSGAAGNGDSYAGAASTAPGGPCVAFGSLASDLVAGDTNGVADIFVREAGVTARVSLAGGGLEADGHSDIWSGVAVSAGCRLVAFGSRATNLVPGDTNGLQDVFVHDRDTGLTTRIPLPPGGPGALRDAGSPSLSEDGRWIAFDTAVNPVLSGSQVYLHDRASQATIVIGDILDAPTRRPVVSGDGRFVAFASYTRGSVPGLIFDDRLRLYDRETGVTRSLAQLGDPSDDFDLAGWPAISSDGRKVAFASSRQLLPSDTNRDYDVYLQDTQTGERVLVSAGPDGHAAGGQSPVLSRDGRFVAFRSASRTLLPNGTVPPEELLVFDAVTGRVDLVLSTTGPWMLPISFTPDARQLALSTNANLADSDTRANSSDTYLVSLDSDNDEVPDTWERLFGMNPYGADSSGDADEDGRTNLEEYRDGTHPRGLFRRMLAEGATGCFTTTLALANEGLWPVKAVVSFLPSQLSATGVVRRIVELPGQSGITLDVGRIAGLESAEFSTSVESSEPIAVERLMTWDSRSYGGHTETAVAEPSTTWHFAEGATHSGFDLFYLLQNPGSTIADVEMRYLLPPPASPIVKNYRVSPHSRRTIWVNYEDPRLASTDVSAAIVSANSQPIVAERAMYLGRPGLMFAAGHAAAGVKAPATSWVIAEGATGPFFDLFLLLSNPGDEAADVQLRYLLPGGHTVDRVHTVAARSRATVWVDYDAPELADTAVSTLVTSLNDVPIVAERAMWWPGPMPANWLEAHAAPASRTLAHHWVLPPSAVMPSGADDFLLLANPGDTAGTARLTLSAANVEVERSYALAARSRTNVWVNLEFPDVSRQPVMASIEADIPIVVERAEYWQAEGVPWEGGTATRATPVPVLLRGEDTFVQQTGAARRASFDELAPGTYTPPLLLDGGDVRVVLTQAATATVHPPGHVFASFATNHLVTEVTDFGNNVVIEFPEGTTAAGLWLATSGGVTLTATDAERGGATRGEFMPGPEPAFFGFGGGPGIRSIRISSGAPPGPAGITAIGDILYARP